MAPVLQNVCNRTNKILLGPYIYNIDKMSTQLTVRLSNSLNMFRFFGPVPTIPLLPNGPPL